MAIRKIPSKTGRRAVFICSLLASSTRRGPDAPRAPYRPPRAPHGPARRRHRRLGDPWAPRAPTFTPNRPQSRTGGLWGSATTPPAGARSACLTGRLGGRVASRSDRRQGRGVHRGRVRRPTGPSTTRFGRRGWVARPHSRWTRSPKELASRRPRPVVRRQGPTTGPTERPERSKVRGGRARGRWRGGGARGGWRRCS